MKNISYRPHAKINLGLIIKGKRPDGYHLLESLMFPVELYDELTISVGEGERCEIELAGVEIDAASEDNLCWKAWRMMKDAFPAVGGVKIHLTKGIPSGAGLGGGSSDAAFTLRGLNYLFELGLSVNELSEMAAKLGADCPFFLYDTPMFASGIGTDLEPFEISLPYDIKIITSDIHSSTPAAYKSLDWTNLDVQSNLKELLAVPVAEWPNTLRNDLENPVFAQHPELAETKAKLYAEGAIYAAMSGSGSAVFGLFER